MAKERRFRNNLWYSNWHRNHLPSLYRRRGHRMHVADRDFTEVCPDCREAIAIVEEVLIRGQNLEDKATTITRKLAGKLGVPAYLVGTVLDDDAWNAIKDEYAELSTRISDLERRVPIRGFLVRNILKKDRPRFFLPDDWARVLMHLHREHQHNCPLSKDPIEDVEAYQRSARQVSSLLPNDKRLPGI